MFKRKKSKMVSNVVATDKKQFHVVTFNLRATKSLVRNDSMEGRDFLVVPTQMITEGVHTGDGGPIYYPADELSKLPVAWNHKPAVVYHPKRNGQGTTACDPIEITARKVGVLMNTKWNNDTKKLGTEVWLEPSRADVVDNRVMEAIENNAVMEVSTGLFMDLEQVEGEWNGEPYIGIAHNLQPDHLALLPDVKGACSIEDGAGFLRLNELGYDQTRIALSSILRDKNENAWIEEVYDEYFVYEDGGKLYKQEYVKDSNGTMTFSGMPAEVTRTVEYKEVTNLNQKGVQMDKKKIVDALIANAKTSWKEEDRDSLMLLSEKILTNMGNDVETLSKVEKPEPTPANNQEPAPANNQEPAPAPAPKLKTLQDVLNEAPTEIREVLEAGVATLNAEKNRLVNTIRSNERNVFSEEYLKGCSVDQLKGMAVLASSSKPARGVNMFDGLAEVANDEVVTETPLEIPVMNFDKN